MKNIAVVFGGKSAEHDISVITGVLTVNSLDAKCFCVIPIYVDRQGVWWTGKGLNKLSTYKNFSPKGKVGVTLIAGKQELFCIKGKKIKSLKLLDCIINCCHGLNGEDGSISGLVKLCDIPICSPDSFCSSFAIDKVRTKIVLKGLGIPTLEYKVCYRDKFESMPKEQIESICKMPFPFIVKPANLGSSIGIESANTQEELAVALKKAFVYDDKVIIEPKLVDFTEINCACYKTDEIVVSECEKPISSADILTFADKYSGKGKREFPAIIAQSISKKIKFYTKKIYSELGFDGIIRIDYMVVGDKIYLNEINTIPGSLAYYLFSPTISGYSKILSRLIETAIEKQQSINKNRYKFTSSILLHAGNLKK